MPPCDVSSRRLDLVTRASDAREGTSALCDARATRRGRRGRVAREEKKSNIEPRVVRAPRRGARDARTREMGRVETAFLGAGSRLGRRLGRRARD